MKKKSLILLLIIVVFLTGCMYPNSKLTKNNVPNELQLQMVQEAVNQYVDNNHGLVPIRTKPSDTPIFQKYLIDFSKLKQQNLLTSVPGTAFENGGVYQYALIHPEQNPTVKLIDLRNTETLRSLQRRLTMYRNEHIYPPFGEEIEEGVFTIDHSLLGLEAAPYVVSPYSQKNLPIVMNTEGTLHIDYRLDLYEALQSFEHTFESGDDIRYILTDHYPFVPAYSLPYTIKNDEPIFMMD